VTLVTSRDKTVAVTVQTRAAAPPQHAFKVNVPIDLSLVFKGWGPFSAVRGVENQTGAWDLRSPHHSSSCMKEESGLTPVSYTYRLR
jgi:hypothetical protein